LTAIPAVICGHLALSQIRKGVDAASGNGMAIAGLVVGYFFVLLMGVAIAAGLFMPAFAMVAQRSQDTKAASDLRQVGVACLAYASDHGGKFPTTLEELVPKYLGNEKVLSDLTNPAGRAGGLEYFGGSTSDPWDKILAATTPSRPRQRRIILHVDSSVMVEKRDPPASSGP
jgi:type II secretory pathway pseudopilin PulG